MKHMKDRWQIPCLRAVIGDQVYYSTLMNASQIADRIETAQQIREAKTLDEYLQRELKPRSRKITKYIQTEPHRFFSSIIVGVFGSLPDWVSFDLTKVAASTNMAHDENVEDSLGLLIFDGQERMFAIDGQHRVKGIQTALEENKDKPLSDQYSIILVAHVDDQPGRIRTRRLFSDINKKAVRVSKGDNVILDEEEVTALVARKIYSEYPLFDGGKLISLTERDELKLGDVETFTNLLTLYAINKALKPLYRKHPRTEERETVNVDALYKVACDFYDFAIESFPSLQAYFHGNLSLREARVNRKDLLFRPVGLVLLARLYAHAETAGSLPKLKRCASIFKFSSPGSHFERILITAGKIDGRDASKKAAYSMALHLLGDLSIEQQDELRQSLMQLTKDPNFKLPKPFFFKRPKSSS